MNNYKPTIGIEVHLELNTNSKVFSLSKNKYSDVANTNINEIDLAYPGVLPTFNKGVLDKAILACLGLNMNINKIMHFDRKNYYYPDLPKGYQITQFNTPIGTDGFITLSTGKKVGISDIHIEEDTCKSLHHNGKTLLNFNRCGVPLIEIVSCADMNSKEEAMDYAERLREIMLYLGVSDCKIEEGSMRFDVNISVSKDDTLGVRSEIKNIGSISNIGDAIDYEVNRKIELLEKGEQPLFETRKFNSDDGSTVFMRAKDTNNDYRYFPEPDIPYVYLEEEDIDNVKKDLVMLPLERRKEYSKRGVSDINVDKLIANKELSDYLNMFLDTDIDFVIASNILLGDISSYLNKNRVSIFDSKLSKDRFILITNALAKEEISSKIFKEMLVSIMEDESIDLASHKLVDSSDEIEKIVKSVLDKYPDSVADYKKGKDNAIKFLMGMCMKESGGKINPKLAMDILINLLNK